METRRVAQSSQAQNEKTQSRALALIPLGYKQLANSHQKKYLEPRQNWVYGCKVNKVFWNEHHKSVNSDIMVAGQ